ncbi:hypothetical protein SAMN05421813_11763 [Daejeonella rubra]|uniref:Uncharacterized protein n=1 Tax=Daejeonella rubra TaxID=990371 RepID=A0A1G9URT0_9SPHI|nr:hypothetical protein [Daejeonella rubra]SDM62619.1 hypothetical protein SAMN05421813_11763 [Daejeonella rubra]
MINQKIKNVETVDIIDIILQSRSEEVAEIKALETDLPVITSESFFTDNISGGFASKEEFLKHIKALNRNELKALQTVLEYMENNEKLDVPPFESLDKEGRNYLWCVKRGKLGNAGFKLLTFGKLSTFIGIYLMGVVKSSVTLTGLHNEANKK